MSQTSISRTEIQAVARQVFGPEAQYTEAGGEGAVHVGTDIKVFGPVETYAPRRGRALIGRWLLNELATRQPAPSGGMAEPDDHPTATQEGGNR